ncbi:phosphotransferase [Mangrovibacillus cuniculi]|uniref:Phosphotransferase n=1 Tax=Mangrovibacillus cuniculi TaxID=2593652 RepID=A0A7S8C9S1_9BACI|nr:phosphotransferase [Mangrovibacillus cuniculi]QPC45881.1 phosphotransferase [Mangrovibacillus cuniculi]
MNPIVLQFQHTIGEIKSMEKLAQQGWTSIVQKVTTDNGVYLLKSSYKDKYRQWLKQEADVLQQFKDHDEIHVPKYFGFIVEESASHLLMSFEEGVSLTTALKEAKTTEERRELIKSFGNFLNHFHGLKIPEDIGKVDWLESQFELAAKYIEKNQTDGSLELLQQLKNNKPTPTQQTFIHGDCTTDNVMVINGRVALFIDVAGMTIGDPRYDESLAIRDFTGDNELKSAFYEGYTRNRVTPEEFDYFDGGLYEFF